MIWELVGGPKEKAWYSGQHRVPMCRRKERPEHRLMVGLVKNLSQPAARSTQILTQR